MAINILVVVKQVLPVMVRLCSIFFVTSRRENVSPGRENVSPGRENVSPGRENVSPGRENVSSLRESVSPCCTRRVQGGNQCPHRQRMDSEQPSRDDIPWIGPGVKRHSFEASS
jgi:hypothetical protein